MEYSGDNPEGLSTAEPDYFVRKDGEVFAGTHVLLELWGAKYLNDPDYIKTVLEDAAKAAGATLLHSHLHHFSPSGGVTGVVMLAESHISIHTWPERDYAAIDIFMCGTCDPEDSVPVIEARLAPERMETQVIRRGRVEG